MEMVARRCLEGVRISGITNRSSAGEAATEGNSLGVPKLDVSADGGGQYDDGGALDAKLLSRELGAPLSSKI